MADGPSGKHRGSARGSRRPRLRRAPLATKLYTDRVCHFAHFPDPTGLHVCERRARDVSSADHLYAKSAAAAWLNARGQQASISYGTPLGSVVNILWGRQARGLRLHLDDEVTPEWHDEAVEPVLGVSVPVEDETLVRRWYVHRVRFDSVGTSRRVRIGTQAFARETEWFGLDECHMTPEGFRTPAVERIIHARLTRTPSGGWRPPVPEPREVQPRRPNLGRRLEAAMESGSRIAVESVCSENEAARLLEGAVADEVAAMLEAARTWLVRQAHAREELFGQLRQAVRDRETDLVRTLLAKADAEAGRERSRGDHDIATRAREFLDEQARHAAWARAAERPSKAASKRVRVSKSKPAARQVQTVDPTEAAHLRVLDILGDLRQLGYQLSTREVLHLVESLSTTVRTAGSRVTSAQREEVDWWLTRGRRLRGALLSEAAPGNTSSAPESRRGPEAQRPGRPGAAPPRPGRGAARRRCHQRPPLDAPPPPSHRCGRRGRCRRTRPGCQPHRWRRWRPQWAGR